MHFFNKHKITIIGIAIGAIGGYAYYHYVGCLSGTCAITSHPWNSTAYGAIMGGLLFSMFTPKKSKNMNLTEIAKKATIVDVRTREEYENDGRITNSINIPLQEIVQRADEIKALSQPIIFCCKSGGRSGQATDFFQQQGIDCHNGGSWQQTEALLKG